MEGLLHTSKMRKIDRLSYLPDHIIYHILSLMDTKYAVSTCVLSKNWRYSWTNIHSLNFCHCSFLSWIAFQGFVTHVLHHCKDLKLVKLEFYCFDGGLWESLDSIDNAIIGTLTSIVFEYAISHRFEELKTDVVDNFPPTLFECQTLKTLKLVQPTKFLTELSSFATLTTLQLYWVAIDLENVTLSGCLNLENLFLIDCTMLKDPVQGVIEVYTISAPRLVNLQISDFLYDGLIVINAPRLKFFNLNGTFPLLLSMDKCPALEKVNIHMSPSTADDMMQELETDNSLKQEYVQRMTLMGKEVFHVKSLTLSVHLSKGKFILYYDTVDAETKIVEFNKVSFFKDFIAETGEEQLLFALPMVQDYLLAYIIAGMASKKCSILSSGFVTHVLHHCKDLNLVKLELYCFDGGLWESLDSIDNAIIGTLTNIVFEYAISRRFEELETDVVDNFPPTLFKCQTLKTLKLVAIDLENDTLSGCLNLENLLLVECAVLEDMEPVMKVFSISAPRLVTLQISGLIYNGLIGINAPRLKFFNLNGTYPLFLSMVKCLSLEKVNIHMSPADDDMMPEFETNKLSMQKYVCGMILMGKGLYHVKSFTFVHLSKETREEQLLIALPMVQDFDLNQLRDMLTEIVEKHPIPSSEIGSTWLIGLAPNF
ncbi:hypothetical protein EZV62_020895 [Acer yangbiense]|uniref:F-box domain-containing protein n=1 Tax=Acer yangbiense TaxID=1000413 RepID=A0A5C7HFM6_9ROSI|nr:hypothetical protein EZV62_020895 [Acer yangbiense]